MNFASLIVRYLLVTTRYPTNSYYIEICKRGQWLRMPWFCANNRPLLPGQSASLTQFVVHLFDYISIIFFSRLSWNRTPGTQRNRCITEQHLCQDPMQHICVIVMRCSRIGPPMDGWMGQSHWLPMH